VFSRYEGLTEEQSGEHWLKAHSELARHMSGVRLYLQNHIRGRLFEVQSFPSQEVSGISQRFDDIATVESCEASPQLSGL
jgi:hypothetical protein